MPHHHINEDNKDYFKYTGPQRLDKAINTLSGLLEGITADKSISPTELETVQTWMQDHKEFAHKHPFNELFPALDTALADGILTMEEANDLIWLCNNLSSRERYFNVITADLQKLHAMMGGIAADQKVTIEELRELSTWLDDHPHLCRNWPFDEIESLVTSILQDGIIDEREHQLLLTFMSEFTVRGEHKALEMPLNEIDVPINGLCAVCPEITLMGKLFCFTGKSKKASRKQLAATIANHGGTFDDNVTQSTDYLVIGADGNPCWAFACYGRKVETALYNRRNGAHTLLVHEYDFWDAIAETA